MSAYNKLEWRIKMIKIYVTLIKKGLREISQVPQELRALVQETLGEVSENVI